MADYMDILKDWELNTANPAIYEHINILFPEFQFQRKLMGGAQDHWASRFKIDLSLPKSIQSEKTVVRKIDFCFREQGEWDNGIPVIEMLMKREHFNSIYETYQSIAQRLGLAMPTPDNVSNHSKREAFVMVERKARLLSELEQYFCWCLENTNSLKCEETRNYLTRERGFTPAMIKQLRFGFVPNWESVIKHFCAGSHKYTTQELEDVCGVLNEDGTTSVGLKHVLAIPYRCAGELKGFIFRAIRKDIIPKYKATRGLDRTSTFFNIDDKTAKGGIIIVEGEFDALTITAHGIQGAVAIGGSDISGNRSRQLIDAFRRGVDSIYLCLDLDSDSEGNPDFEKRFRSDMKTLHTIMEIKPNYKNVYIISFDSPTDPDEYIRTNGIRAFEELIRQAKPWWQYVYDVMNKS